MSTSYSTSKRLLSVVVLSLATSTMATTCWRRIQGKPSLSPAEAKQVLRQMQNEEDRSRALLELYQTYLTGSPDEAIAAMVGVDQCVEQMVHVHEDMAKSHELSRAADRFWQHARLHCLTKALGHDDEACVHFLKMRYWWLALREVDSSWSTSERAKRLREYTEYKCDRLVIEFDKGRTDGKGARFWRELPGGPISPDDWLKATYGERE